MKLDKEFIRLQKQIEKMSKMRESTIARNHKKVLDDLRNRLAKLYEQLEVDGKLTYDGMVKYGRLEKLDKEVEQMIKELYKDNTKAIRGHLTAIVGSVALETIQIVEGATQRRLKGIVKHIDINKTINTEMAGLKWTERMGKHRNDVIWNIQKEIKQGLTQGDTYGTMAKRLKKELEVSTGKANVIVRTEGHRVFAQSQADTLDSITKYGVKMVKKWVSSRDERVRGNNPKDKMNHVKMDGVTIPYEDDFILPDGAKGKGPGLIGDYNDINCRCIMTIDIVNDEKEGHNSSENILDETNENDIITDERISNYKELYDQWDGNDIKSFATKIVDHEDIPLKVERHQLKQANGQCKLSYRDLKMEILSFELNSKDMRESEYQVKTVFHELFHAKSNGLIHDIGKISFDDWAYVDDVFAEVTAHYLTQSIGVTKEITPSYPRHLIDTLPRLKKLPEFKGCNSIVDFGKVAYKYRFSENPSVEWKPLLDAIDNIDHNMIDYSKNYLDYITENKSELVNQLLQNIPKFSEYKSDMIKDLGDAIEDMNNGYIISGNQEMVFENALIITMNRLGVK